MVSRILINFFHMIDMASFARLSKKGGATARLTEDLTSRQRSTFPAELMTAKSVLRNVIAPGKVTISRIKSDLVA